MLVLSWRGYNLVVSRPVVRCNAFNHAHQSNYDVTPNVKNAASTHSTFYILWSRGCFIWTPTYQSISDRSSHRPISALEQATHTSAAVHVPYLLISFVWVITRYDTRVRHADGIITARVRNNWCCSIVSSVCIPSGYVIRRPTYVDNMGWLNHRHCISLHIVCG